MSRRRPKPDPEAPRQSKRNDDAAGYAHMSAITAAMGLNVEPELIIGLVKSRQIEGFSREGKTGQPAWRVSKDSIKNLKIKLQENRP